MCYIVLYEMKLGGELIIDIDVELRVGWLVYLIIIFYIFCKFYWFIFSSLFYWICVNI